MTHNFQYWYSYYDFRIGIKSNAQDYLSIIQDLPISTLKRESWPSHPGLEPMGKIFQNLEQFLTSNQSWCSDSCTTQDLKKISDQLNHFYLILLIQKHYCSKLWKTDKRRIQASICHYYFLLQRLIQAILPEGLDSIAECRQNKRLCLVLLQFQKTINNSLENFEHIYKFMCSDQFFEERKLTNDFFSQLGELLKNLVTIQISKNIKIPELYKHILRISNAEIAKNNHNGKKTILENCHFDIFDEKMIQSLRDRSSTVQRNREISKGRLNKSLDSIKPINSEEEVYELPKIFDFSKKIKKKMIIRDPILIIDIQDHKDYMEKNSIVSQQLSTQCGSSALIKNPMKVGKRQSFVIQLQSTTSRKKKLQMKQAQKYIEGISQTIYMQRKSKQSSLSQKQAQYTAVLKQKYQSKSKTINLSIGTSNKKEQKKYLSIQQYLDKFINQQ